VLCEPSVNLRRLLAEERLDLALITCTPGAETGEVLRREPVVWATAERHLAHENEPLPLALFQPGCSFREWALAALSEQGRSYRIAYTSASISGVLAAVTAGLAVTVLCRSVLPAGVRPLGVEEGFSVLPYASITLHRGSAVSAVAECLGGYIREGFGPEISEKVSAPRSSRRSPWSNAISQSFRPFPTGHPFKIFLLLSHQTCRWTLGFCCLRRRTDRKDWISYSQA